MCIRDSHSVHRLVVLDGALGEHIRLALQLAVLVNDFPVSYTHLDVYKRQGLDCDRRFQRLAVCQIVKK